jgi:SAM-dependent methyltransferase
MARTIPRSAGRRLFGDQAATYDRVRPEYPPAVYRILRTRCGLHPGSSVFEIGPGTGKATRELLRQGADPITVIEPDARMLRFLRASVAPWAPRVRFVHAPFESADLPSASFDLGVAATSFHWTRERTSLRKAARLLRPGGWLAVWWSQTGDPDRPTRFTRAADPLFAALPTSRRHRLPERVRRNRAARRRLETLRSIGPFERARMDRLRWTRTLDTRTVVDLFGTFSEVSTCPKADRDRFFDGIRSVVDGEFGGRVTLHALATVYTARRR